MRFQRYLTGVAIAALLAGTAMAQTAPQEPACETTLRPRKSWTFQPSPLPRRFRKRRPPKLSRPRSRTNQADPRWCWIWRSGGRPAGGGRWTM